MPTAAFQTSYPPILLSQFWERRTILRRAEEAIFGALETVLRERPLKSLLQRRRIVSFAQDWEKEIREDEGRKRLVPITVLYVDAHGVTAWLTLQVSVNLQQKWAMIAMDGA